MCISQAAVLPGQDVAPGPIVAVVANKPQATQLHVLQASAAPHYEI
jgi:hypothetical protein